MQRYQIEYYSERVQNDILKLPRTIQAKYLHYVDLMEEFGANLGMPHTKSVGNGLFELRVKGQEGIARVFYCIIVDKTIVMLHSFIKKTDKTPKKELDIANKRKCEVQNG